MKLTIGIPTYNRDVYLSATLKNIKKSINYYKGDWNIEIVIVDNKSIDNTEEVVKKFSVQNEKIDIKYFKNKVNIGFDRNVDKVIRYASGSYVLFVSDDDFLEENSIEYITNIINRIKVTLGVIYINSFCMNIDENNIYKNNEFLFETIKKNKLFKNATDLIQTTGIQLYGSFTGIVFNQKLWIENFSSKCYDTSYIQLCMAYRILHNNPVYVIYDRLVKLRMQNSTGRWADDGRLFFGLFKAFLPSKNLYSKKIYNLLYKDRLWEIRRSYLIYKFKNGSNQLQLKKYLMSALDKEHISFWFIDIVLIYLPRIPFFNWFYSFIKRQLTQKKKR